MSRLLVVLHVYYHDQIDYFIEKLANITGCEWDLVVTCSDSLDESVRKIRDFKPDAAFVLVDNAGYDVWPFIKVIRDTDFSKYEYVLKLHTKRFLSKSLKIEGLDMHKWFWRDTLVNPILKSKERFSRCLAIMESNENLGYICSYELHLDLKQMHEDDEILLRQEAERISLGNIKNGRFCAGTMFLARIQALKKLKEIDFTDEMWAFKAKSGDTGTMAHVYERLLCLIMRAAGYKSKGLPNSKRRSSKVFCRRTLSPILKSVFSLERRYPSRYKYLTLMGVRINLSKLKNKRLKKSVDKQK